MAIRKLSISTFSTRESPYFNNKDEDDVLPGKIYPEDIARHAESNQESLLRKILQKLGIPNHLVSGNDSSETWEDGVEFDRESFGEAEYKKYQEEFFKK